MKKIIASIVISFMATVSCFAQYNTTYNNKYGGTIGTSSTSRSNGVTTTSYYNRYGGRIGTSTTSSNYTGGYSTSYYNNYGGTTGTATTY